MNSVKPHAFVRYDNSPDHNRKQSGDGGGDDMLQRVKALEKDIQEIRTDVAVIKSNYATKADIGATKATISEAKFSIIVWVVGAIFIAQLLPSIIGAIRAAFV